MRYFRDFYKLYRMNRIFLILFLLYPGLRAVSQNNSGDLSRPKLVVGIVVDQMRWDYLYRYYNRYGDDGGFKRLIRQGFSCENTFIPYVPTVTACGHSCVYTGSVPAINGITGNSWWDYRTKKIVYCTSDDSVKAVGSTSEEGKMSPRNLKVTTIGDELRLATNFQSRVVGIAIKDRGAILPAGHSANAAYWYDARTGDWITSSYYMKELPKWVKDLNAKKMVDKYFAQDWNTLYPLSSYTQSTPDQEPFEPVLFGSNGFPYNLKQFVGKNYGVLPVTPYGNSFSFEMAKAAVIGEQLGGKGVTDLLALSLSTPDYIGHTFGPNSVEAEDGFLRLDKDLGKFMDFLDQQVGKGSYLIFLTADHGALQVPGFLGEHKIPAGSADPGKIDEEINRSLREQFKTDKLVIGFFNNQVYLNRELIDSVHLDRDAISRSIVRSLQQQPGVARAFALEELSQTTLNSKIREMVANGYDPSRSGDIHVIFEPQWLEGFMKTGTSHGVWNAYDAHIPLLWYGWNIKPGNTKREVYMTDIAPTLASLLHIQMPSGCVGHFIDELKN
jgi:predicted AlkP superfamily pyrophosphatase or phosphodiesterase